jgi:glycosyltransferase involved in cell wall biosynthesis
MEGQLLTHTESSPNQRLRVLHIITGLDPGGAETMLFRLLGQSDRDKFSHHVVSLTSEGVLGDAIRNLGISVNSLEIRGRFPLPWHLFKLARTIQAVNPNVVQTWLYHADLLGGLTAKILRSAPVIWGVHHTNLDPRFDRRATIWTAKLCARLSSWVPKKIICCSYETRNVHSKLGYPMDAMLVIPNGFDLAQYRSDDQARHDLRSELGVDPETILIGMAARYHPQKDHPTFLRAARLLSSRMTKVHFVLSGVGIDSSNTHLLHTMKKDGLADRVHLLGYRKDMPRVFAALDIATLSSHGEAFPNVIGEAMACGVPCVVTDVGDSAEMVGDTGFVVSPRDFSALADAWERMINLGEDGRMLLGQQARSRVRELYDLPSVVARYEEVFREVASIPK